MATRTWSFTSQPNTSSGNKTITVPISKFTVTGDTSSYLGSVGANPLTITHYHSSTSSTHKWKLRVELLLGDGTTKLVSNTVEHSCNNSVVGWTNTIASITNEQLAVLRSNGIKSVSVVIENVPSSGGLYWRANSTYPFTMNLTFNARAATAPVISGTSLNWGTDTMYYFAGVGSLNFGFEADYDTDMGAKFASAKLELEYEGVPLAGDPDEVVLNDGEFTFFGPINTTGTVTWTCTVTDSLGNSSNATGSFTVATHVPATISTFTVQRYGFDIQGNPVEKNDGTYAQISINVSGTQAVSVQKKDGTTVTNNAKISLRIQEEGSSSYTTTVLQASLAPTGSYSVTKSRTIDPATRYASSNYIYTLIVEDYVTATTTVVTLASATALLNIEKNGVSIGKRVNKGTAATPIFDVAMDTEFDGSVKIGGYNMNSVSQSQTLSLGISSQFDVWTTTGAPKIMRVGPFVYLTGGIITTSQLTHSTNEIFMFPNALPAWACPKNTVGFVQSGNSTDFFIKIEITTNGWVHLWSQYQSGTIAQGIAFYLDCNWIAADVFPS